MKVFMKSVRLSVFLLFLIAVLLINTCVVSADTLLWQPVGGAGLSAGHADYTSIAVDSKGAPYVAYQDKTISNLATVRKYDGTNWVTIGGPIYTEGSGSSSTPLIAIAPDNTPYVAYLSSHDRLTNVKKYNGTSWEQVGEPDFSAGGAEYMNFTLDNIGTPYVAYRDNVNSNKLTVMKYDGTDWGIVGALGFSENQVWEIDISTDTGGIPYVVYYDGSTTIVKKYDSSTSEWVRLGNTSLSGGYVYRVDIAIGSGDTPYVTYEDSTIYNKAVVKKFDSTSSNWIPVGNVGFSAGSASEPRIIMDSNHVPYVLFRTGNSATVMKYDTTDNSWGLVGNAGFSAGNVEYYIGIALDNTNKPYVVYQDESCGYKATVCSPVTAYNLNYSAGEHGVISGDALQTVASGGSGTEVRAVADPYYHFEKWSDDSTDNPRTDSGVIGDITISANFYLNTEEATDLNTIPGAQTVNEDDSLEFSESEGNAIVIKDPGIDVDEHMNVRLTAENGILTLSNTTGLTLSAGDGTGDTSMTFTGTRTNINDALDGLSFEPAADFNGAASITIAADDMGGSVEGTTRIDEDEVEITVNSVNDVPSFTKGADQTVNEDCGLKSVAGWATGISAGQTGESGQTLTFTATNTDNSLFSAQPAVAADGTLTYTPAGNMNGSATVTLTLSDDGGTANGGVDTSAEQTFTITVNSANDAPTFTTGANQTVDEDCGAKSITTWANGISVGPDDEAGQTLTFTATNSNNSLFSVQPAVAAGGTLTYTPADNMNGIATVSLTLKDSGGTDNGGDDTSEPQTFTITVNSVNDVPFFTAGANQTVDEDCGAKSIADWASGISFGPTVEEGQTLTFTATNTDNSLFSAQPAVTADGILKYTPAADKYGIATVTLTLKDSGGTDNGGVDTSASQTFTITVNSVNDAPSFTKGANQIVNEDCGLQTVANWATGISAGPADESAQTLTFTATNSNNSLFTAQPEVTADGTLTYTPADNMNGSATVTLTLKDSGGTDNGGVDTSASQTFTIDVGTVNDVPSFTKGADQTVNEDCGLKSVAGWATGISAGQTGESSQTLTFTATNDNTSLFSAQPAVAADGTLTYTPADNMTGSATVTLTLKDSGGIANGGVDTSAAQTFTIAVNSVNDAPSFTAGADQTVNEDCGAQTAAGWATGIFAGPSDESDQELTFILTNDNNSLFSIQPAIAADGTLTYTVADNTSGIATVTVSLRDNSGGTDTSAAQTFTIKVCAQSGSGTIALSQSTFAAGNTGSTITFTYTAAVGGMEHGKLSIEVPDGWSSPSNSPAAYGYTTASAGTVSISGSIITISDITIGSGDTISITYGDKSGAGPGATASKVKGIYEWKVKSAAMADSALNDLNSSPKIGIVPAKASATRSSIAVDKDSIPADGITTATVTVILTDDFGNTASDHSVSLQGSSSSTISPSSIATDSDGKAVFIVKSIKAGTVTYTAKDTIDNVTLADTAVVHFEPGINFPDTPVSLSEGGSAEYKISLVSEPEEDVTVTGSVYGELSVSPASWVFNAGNWNIEKVFTFTVEENSSKDGNRSQTVTNSVYSSDPLYDALDFDITVNIMDNDTPGILIGQNSINIAEGGAAGGYNVSLTTKPKDVVTVEIDCDSSDVVIPSTIVFTPDNWDVSQEVTVSAVNDTSVEGTETVSVTHSASSQDTDYDGITVAAVTVNITDNDYYSSNANLSDLKISQGVLTPVFDPGKDEYTVNVGNGVDSITITPTAAENHAVITVNETAVASGTASASITLSIGKNIIEVKVAAQDNIAEKIYTVEVSRAAVQNDDRDDSDSSSGGGGTTPPGNTPAPPENNTVSGGSINTAAPKLDSGTGKASTAVSSGTLASAFNGAKAGEDGLKTVELNIPKVQGAKAYEPTLPASYLSAGTADTAIKIKTDIATVTVPGNMLTAANAAGAQNVSLTIAAVDKTRLAADIQAKIGNKSVIELNLNIDGKRISWSNEAAPVTVSVPYTPTAEELQDPEHITVWYIDGSGNAIAVPSGRYDPATGKVTFSTTHFSKYAVVYVEKNFRDLGSHGWAKKQIEVLASKGVIITSGETFSPGTGITRADYLMMLVRALGLSADFTGSFDDIKSSDYYYQELGTARKLGITTGIGNNKFNPSATISRQDMMVMTERALRNLKKISKAGSLADLEKYTDKDSIAAYAKGSMAALVGEGLIEGGGSNINPLSETTRAEAAVFVYRIYNIR